MYTRCVIGEESPSYSSETPPSTHLSNLNNLNNNTNSNGDKMKEKNVNKEHNSIIHCTKSYTLSEEEKLKQKKTNETIGDVSIQTFFLIGLLSQHATIHFTVEHSPSIDAAYPHIKKIDLGNDIVVFDDYLKTIHSKSYTPKELILTTNDYFIDAIGLFGYFVRIDTNDLYDKIDSIEKDDIPFLYREDVSLIGTQLHNHFYDETNEIILNNTSSLINDLFDK